MVNKNYRKGAGFEYRRLEYLLSQPDVVKGNRFYASKGICDLYYVKTDGTYHEEQCKYTSDKKRNFPYISTEEFLELLQYGLDHEDVIHVYLVSKKSHQPVSVWKLN